MQPQEQYDSYQDVTNRMQYDLMGESEDPMKWVEDKSEDFRKIITENPELLDLYREDPKEFRKVIKEKFEELDDKRTLH